MWHDDVTCSSPSSQLVSRWDTETWDLSLYKLQQSQSQTSASLSVYTLLFWFKGSFYPFSVYWFLTNFSQTKLSISTGYCTTLTKLFFKHTEVKLVELSHVDKPFGSVVGMGHASSGHKDVTLLLRSTEVLAKDLQGREESKRSDFPGISNTQNKHKNSFKKCETSHPYDLKINLKRKFCKCHPFKGGIQQQSNKAQQRWDRTLRISFPVETAGRILGS